MFSSWRLFSATTRGMGILVFRSLLSFRGRNLVLRDDLSLGCKSREVCFWLFLTPRVVSGVSHWTGHGHWLSSPKPWESQSRTRHPVRITHDPREPEQVWYHCCLSKFPLWPVSSLLCYLLVPFQKSWKIFCPAFLSGALDQITQLSFPGVEVLPSCSFIYDFKKSEVDLALLGHSNASSSLFTPSFSEIIKIPSSFSSNVQQPCCLLTLSWGSQFELHWRMRNQMKKMALSLHHLSALWLCSCSSCTVDEISRTPPGPGGLVIPLCLLSNFLLSLYSFHVSPFFLFYYIIVETCQLHI